jgi:hypothetical protein
MSDAAAAEESYGTGRTSRPLKGPFAAFGHCRLHRRDRASADALGTQLNTTFNTVSTALSGAAN